MLIEPPWPYWVADTSTRAPSAIVTFSAKRVTLDGTTLSVPINTVPPDVAPVAVVFDASVNAIELPVNII